MKTNACTGHISSFSPFFPLLFVFTQMAHPPKKRLRNHPSRIPVFIVTLIIVGLSFGFAYARLTDPRVHMRIQASTFVFFVVLMALLYYNFFKVVMSNAGEVPDRWHRERGLVQEQGMCVETKGNLGRRYCRKCDHFKPDRTHHCRNCDVWYVSFSPFLLAYVSGAVLTLLFRLFLSCFATLRSVLKFDHHCIFVNNCIGFHNYKYFMLFLLYGGIGCLFVAGNLVYTGLFEVTTSFAKIATMLMVFVLGTAFGISLLGFLVFHLYMAARGCTTIEYTEKEGSLRNGRAYSSPFHVGVWANWRLILGPTFFSWFLPVSYTSRQDIAAIVDSLDGRSSNIVRSAEIASPSSSSTYPSTSAPPPPACGGCGRVGHQASFAGECFPINFVHPQFKLKSG